MPYLLNFIYLAGLLLLSPWLLYKSLTTGKYRRGLWRKITGHALLRRTGAPCIWLHGVSVGEIHLLKQVVARFRALHSDWEGVDGDLRRFLARLGGPADDPDGAGAGPACRLWIAAATALVAAHQASSRHRWPFGRPTPGASRQPDRLVPVDPWPLGPS